ncbi:helix-turn-helix-domain containing protein type [Diaporthe amygdali]|uniref:helix-turn-helix-domain containing protein type n=1 Tax=Phomopsis amygdali TaxID=1214568 RepID=UPI0022FEA1FB|nr:helix-turn-helix-domain containing protein type [Diaporthe amygdali]KAJ0117438.1 helix-turn-helix-domain containing protein type [Diaporthe amygdali]
MIGDKTLQHANAPVLQVKMADTSFFNSIVPMMGSILDALQAILTKAESHAKENNVDVNAEYATAKLYEDMKPVPFQVQAVSNGVKLFVERVAGVQVGVWDDDETTFEQLFARINKTRELLNSVKPEAVNDKESQLVDVKAGPFVYKTSGLAYATTFAIPNIYFHLQTTYAILRMKGVPLGKRDYLFSFMTKDPNSTFAKA